MDISTMMNTLTMQRHGCYANLLMSVFVIMNVFNTQHRMYYDDYSRNVFNIVTVLMGNSVRVVLLIARGWLVPRQPRVNVRKEIQRHRC